MNLKIYEKTKYNNIYKHRKNGTYAVDLSLGYNSSGKRIRTTRTGFLSEKEAKLFLSDINRNQKIKQGIIFKYKFEDFLNEYFDWCLLSGKVKEETLRRKRGRFKLNITPFFKGIEIDKIDENMILKYHAFLETKDFSEDTKITLHSQLSAYFNYLQFHKKIITINPCRVAQNFKEPKRRISYRTIEQMNLLWKTILEDDKYSLEIRLRAYCFTYTLFTSGFRPGEFFGLKIRDIKYDILNNDEITIEEIPIVMSQTLYYGKGGWILSDGKTDSSLDTIFVGKIAFKPLFDYIKYMQKLGYIFSENDFIFTNPKTNKVFSPETIRYYIDYYINKAGLPHTRPKDMRSSHGTFLLSNGYSLEDVQSRLRHSTKQTTEKYYATFYEETKRELARNIDKLIT